jgi:hypothetical protein
VIGGHERHRSGATSCKRSQRVVTLARRVDNLDTAGLALDRTFAGLALEDDDNRLGQAPGGRCVTDALDERPSRAGAIAPPSRRPGTNHVGGIDQQHRRHPRARGTTPPRDV